MTKLIFPSTHTYIRYTYEDENTHEYPADWEANFTWTGREDYLQWVAEWKACLKQKIAAIRMEKTDRRNRDLTIAARNGANVERQQLRIDCYNLLLIRHIGKRRSAMQRDDQRNSLAA
jgi:hypothetical protein